MSLAELQDDGTPHPWANLRVNNLTVDNILTAQNIDINDIEGKLTVTNSSNNGRGNITINQTNLTTPTNDIQFSNNGVASFYIGENPTNNDAYCMSVGRDLILGTNGLERLRIDQAGITNDNNVINLLGIQGTRLVFRNNITPGPDPEPDILIGKTISSNDNTILVNTNLGETNINDVIDQPLKMTSSNVQFLNLNLIGGLSAGGSLGCSQIQTNAINSPGLGNNCLINGINPLTTDTNLNNHISAIQAHGTNGDVVGTDNIQTLTNKTISGANYTSNSVTHFPVSLNTSTLTALRTVNFQDSDGILALTSQIPVNFVTLNTAQTISNKTLDSSCRLQDCSIVGNYTSNIVTHFPITFNTAGLTAPRVITWSNQAGTVILDSASQTLSNKTLTNPIISTINNTGILTLPTTTTTLVGRDTIDILTNKTINNLVTSGSQVTFFSSTAGMLIFRWTTSTIGALTSTGISIPIQNTNNTYTVETTTQGFVTAGTNINKGLSRKVTSSILNLTGPITSLIGNLQSLTANSMGLNAVMLTHTTSAGNIVVQVTGIAGDTINYTGETIVYF